MILPWALSHSLSGDLTHSRASHSSLSGHGPGPLLPVQSLLEPQTLDPSACWTPPGYDPDPLAASCSHTGSPGCAPHTAGPTQTHGSHAHLYLLLPYSEPYTNYFWVLATTISDLRLSISAGPVQAPASLIWTMASYQISLPLGWLLLVMDV